MLTSEQPAGAQVTQHALNGWSIISMDSKRYTTMVLVQVPAPVASTFDFLDFHASVPVLETS
jgi:hypothetical protein